ncbi:glycosyltransferase 87 family protein [Streptomyces ipomoeae]|uniref:Putative membrane protein n=1 Tax=Streptomyces ipomoeae 91-03 TaxID=698759 RepID=L1KS20_9ACTN|nr:putative membrane protein [Streptomyces ipomoeae 91-03]
MPPVSSPTAPPPPSPTSPRTRTRTRAGAVAAPRRVGADRWDRLHGRAWLYWLGCAVFALLLALTTTLTPHRIWGVCAALGYAVAAVCARRTPRPWGRAGLPAAVAGSVVLPLVVLIGLGAAQSEVHVVEHSGTLLLHSGSPYEPHPLDVDDYNPYLPGMALLGLPHALFGDTPLADARLWFAAVFLTCMYAAPRGIADVRFARAAGAARPYPLAWPVGARSARPARPVDAVLLLAAFPAVALPLAVGGVDLPVIGLMCLGPALAGRGGSGTAAGLAMGAAAALKWTAWPLLPVGLALLAVTAGRRAAVRAGVVAMAVAGVAVLPAIFANPHAFVEHVVLFPLGEAGVESPATSPLPGYLLATYVPGGSALATGALVVAAVAVAASLVARPPRTVLAAADRLAIGLGLAMCLMPATRFGYLAYPLVLALWFRAAPAFGGRPLSRS